MEDKVLDQSVLAFRDRVREKVEQGLRPGALALALEDLIEAEWPYGFPRGERPPVSLQDGGIPDSEAYADRLTRDLLAMSDKKRRPIGHG